MIDCNDNLNSHWIDGKVKEDKTNPIIPTHVKKEAWIESDCLGLRTAIKKFGIGRFKENCVAATEGFEWVLKNRSISQTKIANTRTSLPDGLSNPSALKRTANFSGLGSAYHEGVSDAKSNIKSGNKSIYS